MHALGFQLEWFDPHSSILHTDLYLKYILEDGTIEILKGANTAFLKRIHYPELTKNQLFLGNTITIHSRQYLIKAYANKFTKDYMEERETHYLCVVPSTSSNNISSLLTLIKEKGFYVLHFKTAGEPIKSPHIDIRKGDIVIELIGIKDNVEFVDKTQAFQSTKSKIHENSSNNVDFLDLTRSISRLDPLISIVCLQLNDLREIINSIKSSYNLLLKYRPSGQFATTEFSADYCGLCILKPTVLKSNRLDEAIRMINQAGFVIVTALSIHFTYAIADDFFAAYKGNVENYTGMIEDICAGTSIALGLVRQEHIDDYNKGNGLSYSHDFIDNLRELAGPFEPRLATVLRPNSLRAKFGKTSTKNGIHVTDLVGDGERECEFIFELVSGL